MLTNDDLRKIGELIDQKLEQKFDEKFEPIKEDIRILKKNDKKLRKDLNLILKHFDGERVYHESQNYKDRKPFTFTSNGIG